MTGIHLRTPPFDWTCGYCGSAVTVTEKCYHSGFRHLAVGRPKPGETALVYSAIACPNPACRELTLAVRLAHYKPSLGHAYPIGTAGDSIRDWQLLPEDPDE